MGDQYSVSCHPTGPSYFYLKLPITFPQPLLYIK